MRGDGVQIDALADKLISSVKLGALNDEST